MKPETIDSVIKYAKIGVGIVALFAGGAYTGHVTTKPAEATVVKTSAACPPVAACRDTKVSITCLVQKADPIKIEFVPSRGVK